MASVEYAQLVEFLGRQFTAIDHRFTAMERQSAGLREETAAFTGESRLDPAQRLRDRVVLLLEPLESPVNLIEVLLSQSTTRR